jgi:hypothetical protein
MKITKDSLCFTVTTEGYINHHCGFLNQMINTYTVPEEKMIYEIKREFYSISENFRVLVLSNKTKNNLENYLVPKTIRIDVLKTLPNRSDIIQIDENNVVKYIKNDDVIVVSHDSIIPENGLISFWYMINLKTGFVRMDGKNDIGYDDMIKKYYSKFLVLVTYLELTDVTLNVVTPNTKRGDIFKGNFIKNSSNLNVIHVNSNWNTMKIVVGEFGVRSHMRLQRVGKGLCEFKWVFINSFKKNLVIRTPQKQLQCG